MALMTDRELDTMVDDFNKAAGKSNHVFIKQFQKLIDKIKYEEELSSVTFLEGVRRYFDPSLDVEERQLYYSFYFYLRGLNNCIRNADL